MIDDQALDTLFRNARTANGFLDRPVPDELLRQAFDLMKMAPTSANSQPGRFVFLRSAAAKEVATWAPTNRRWRVLGTSTRLPWNAASRRPEQAARRCSSSSQTRKSPSPTSRRVAARVNPRRA